MPKSDFFLCSYSPNCLERQMVCLMSCMNLVVSGRPSRYFLGPKFAQKFCFLGFTYITHLFGLSRTRLNAIITIVLYLTVLYGMALLAQACGLYLLYGFNL